MGADLDMEFFKQYTIVDKEGLIIYQRGESIIFINKCWGNRKFFAF